MIAYIVIFLTGLYVAHLSRLFMKGFRSGRVKAKARKAQSGGRS